MSATGGDRVENRVKFLTVTMTALASVLTLGALSPLGGSVVAQSSDPYISAIDDRPAARLQRKRAAGVQPAPSPLLPSRKPPNPNRLAPTPPGAGPDMVTIQPGRFKMGSTRYERRRDPNEGPQVEVDIGYAFEIGRYEVTFDEWDACVAGGGCDNYKPSDNDWGRGRRPVTNVSFEDAQNYIQWLNAKTGLEYRLPSESEWEYVARAGRLYPFSTQLGLSISASAANFNGEFPYGPNGVKGSYLRKTVPVGSYSPNGFGVYDIHGNVYEWVTDCYVDSHRGNPLDGSPRTDGDCDARIMRGGSWVTHGYQMRAAKRLRYTTDHRYDDFGFRLARTLG